MGHRSSHCWTEEGHGEGNRGGLKERWVKAVTFEQKSRAQRGGGGGEGKGGEGRGGAGTLGGDEEGGGVGGRGEERGGGESGGGRGGGWGASHLWTAVKGMKKPGHEEEQSEQWVAQNDINFKMRS